jgi:hypothetical protein
MHKLRTFIFAIFMNPFLSAIRRKSFLNILRHLLNREQRKFFREGWFANPGIPYVQSFVRTYSTLAAGSSMISDFLIRIICGATSHVKVLAS